MVYFVHASHYIDLSKVVGECFGERADNEFLKTASVGQVTLQK